MSAPLYIPLVNHIMEAGLSHSKRQSIIKGATAMFLSHGFNAVSMDKIAQAAPVSKATLYKYFDSKHDLLAAVINELCTSLLQVMDELVIDSGNVENNLKTIASAFIDLIFAEESLAIYRLVIAECYVFPELGRLVYESGPKNALTLLERYLENANQRKHVNIPNSGFAADAFFSLLKGDLHFQCLLGIKAPPSAEEKTVLINQVVSLYMQGLAYEH